MTIQSSRDAVLKKKYLLFLLFITSLSFLCLCVLYATAIRETILQTLALSIKTIVPSLFPYMIISGILTNVFSQNYPLQSREKTTRISLKDVLPSLAISLFCGFPIGAKCVIDLYNKSMISKEDANRLFPLMNQTGFAFVTLALGEGMLKNFSLGLFLYCIMIFSCIVTFFILPKQKPNAFHTPTSPNKEREFSFVCLIQNATLNILYVVGFLVAFSIPIALIELLVPHIPLKIFLTLPLELVSATQMIIKNIEQDSHFFLPLLAFTLSFGGFCVGMQSEMIVGGNGISMYTYYLRKAVQGIIAFILCFVFRRFIM